MVRERKYWVAAEATAGAAALHRATGEDVCARWQEMWWDHIAEVFLGPGDGS